MAKSMHGEGLIRERDDGRWEYREMIGYRDDGRRNFITFYARDKKELKKKIEKHRAKKGAGMRLDVQPNFSEWADIWFELHKQNISPVTQQSYKYTLRILKGYFGTLPLGSIKEMHLDVFLQELRAEGRSDSGIAQCRGMLFQIFQKAEANDLVLKNPVALMGKKRKKKEHVDDSDKAFTKEEVSLLMLNLPYDLIGLSIRLMLGTGIRGQEMLGLEPRHIATDGSEVQIHQAMQQVKGTAFIGDVKTYTSYRTVPIPENLRECALLLRKFGGKYIWESQKNPGNPCNPSYFRKLFKDAITDIDGVRALTPHKCRHTYLTLMHSLNIDVTTLKDLAGHSGINMTEHYVHVQKPIRESAAALYSNEYIPRLKVPSN